MLLVASDSPHLIKDSAGKSSLRLSISSRKLPILSLWLDCVEKGLEYGTGTKVFGFQEKAGDATKGQISSEANFVLEMEL